MDFNTLKPPSPAGKPTDPEEIFRQLPRGKGAINDLWRGQTDVLRAWHKRRKDYDLLISLNTGAGKTIVGLLIAQSLVNEGVENVVFACGTIDLVLQTAREADRLGLQYTTRAAGKFNNDLFESGKAFCISTYQTVFQPFTVFKNDKSIGALILDDAHTAEPILRDAFTLSISRKEHEAAYDEIAALLRPAFRDLGRHQTFDDTLTGLSSGTLLVPPNAVFLHQNEVVEILKKHKIPSDKELRYAWGHLKDHLGFCAFIFTKGLLEITPPFLPVNYLPQFSDNAVRRIYLSATLNFKSDLARSFGKVPPEISAPNNDAGEGERLILFSKYLGKEAFDINHASGIASKNKLLVSVPSYQAAKEWAALAEPPKRENFSAELEKFRKGKKGGAFILVFRLDGIDLPDDACRLMLIDGLPTGTSLIDRYHLDQLGMFNHHSARLANRLTQLFGRINRGRQDYGVFLISGKDINVWLSNERNLALLPRLLRQQVQLGHLVQEQLKIKTPKEINTAIDKVLTRDSGWISYYTASVNAADITPEAKLRTQDVQDRLVSAGIAEAECATALWQNNIPKARSALTKVIEDVSRADRKIAGWLNIWIGLLYDAEGDKDAAGAEYERAASRLGPQVTLPKIERTKTETKSPSHSRLVTKMLGYLNHTSENTFQKEVKFLETSLLPLGQQGASYQQCEEAVRSLGEMLGFLASRPDNEGEPGPDVLWRDGSEKLLISLELKTDKKDPALYNSEDISKGHNYIQWIANTYQGDKNLGLLFVGPMGSITTKANPSADMYHCTREALAQLGQTFVAGLLDIRKSAPLGRIGRCEDFEKAHNLSTTALFQKLAMVKMANLEKSSGH
jgi:hypothetical protein